MASFAKVLPGTPPVWERVTTAPQSAEDWCRVRMTLRHAGGTCRGLGGRLLSHGDVVEMPQGEAEPFLSGGRAELLGFIPAPDVAAPAIDGPARTVRFEMVEHRTRSAHLGRNPQPGELATLPADEARAFVRAGLAQFDAASARDEYEATLRTIPGITAESAHALTLALDDVLRALRLYAAPMPTGGGERVSR
jgi:hypothetical protein